jgi:hypothetical protein
MERFPYVHKAFGGTEIKTLTAAASASGVADSGLVAFEQRIKSRSPSEKVMWLNYFDIK